METTDHKETILFIDDTPANLEVLIRLFQTEGYRVRAVTSGEMGIRAAENEPPDLILLDVNMPGMKGFDVCRALKKSARLNSIPVIFISALTETFDKVTAFEAGGVDYITKPIQLQESVARVKTHLALRKYQQMLEEKNEELNETLTRLKETQSQLIHSDKMASLGVLTAGIAHEINNPVSFISSSSIGLRKNISFFLETQKIYESKLGLFSEEAQAEINEYKAAHDFNERLDELTVLTENIASGAQRISLIVQSLRTFSRLDEKGIKEINILENIESTLLLLTPRLDKRIRIVRQYSTLPQVPCFPGKISQVFMNIFSNAIEAIESKGQMGEEEQIIISAEVVTENQIRHAEIKIQDTGTGIPAPILKSIFDPFFTTKPVGKGLGLGLSISNNIIMEHGGKLEAFNCQPAGAIFRILLPLT